MCATLVSDLVRRNLKIFGLLALESAVRSFFSFFLSGGEGADAMSQAA